MKGSIIILCFFIAGIIAGRLEPDLLQSTQGASMVVLALLMLLVGFSIGTDKQSLKAIRQISPAVAWLPLCTIVGTLLASMLAALFIQMNWADALAIGSGFAYYSLSSIIITEYKGAELGTIALLANISREVLTLTLAPLMARYFGKLAPISAAGATSMDTTLPIITQVSGQQFAVIAIFHGIVVDFSVPILVPLFCSLG